MAVGSAQVHPGTMGRTRRHNDRGSVVWWAVAVIGCAVAMLGGLVLVAQGAVRSAQAQAVADLAALAAVGVDEAGHPGSARATADVVSRRNACVLEAANPRPTGVGGRRWRVRVSRGPIAATAAAEPDPVHPHGASWP